MVERYGDDPLEVQSDTGVQMPAFTALLDDLLTTLDSVLVRTSPHREPSIVPGVEPPRLTVYEWTGPGVRRARMAFLGANSGTFAVSCAAFPAVGSAFPLFSFEYLVVRERLQLVTLDLLDTDPGDDGWSRDQLRRARRILELPVTPADIPPLPPWAAAALSPSAIVVGTPAKLPAAGLVRRAVVETLDAFLFCSRPSAGAATPARHTAQNRFHDAMLAAGPGLAFFREVVGAEVDALASAVLFPRIPDEPLP